MAARHPGEPRREAGDRDLRRLGIPPSVVWTWKGTTDFVEHEVRSDGGRLGLTYWTIWTGDQPSRPAEVSARGVAEAEQLVAALRVSGADHLSANRALRAHGYMATEHAPSRADCNCADCQPVVEHEAGS